MSCSMTINTKNENGRMEKMFDRNIKSRLFDGIRHTHGKCRYGMSVCLFGAMIIVFMSPYTMADARNISYLYTLSNFNGPIQSHWANIYVDKERKDIYVMDSGERDIRIFDENGMEVFLFGDDDRFGTVMDLTVDSEGNIIILSRKRTGVEITVSNYRGEPISRIEVKDLPPEYSRFRPERIIYHKGNLYFLEAGYLRITVTDMGGAYKTGFDLAPLLNISEKKREQNEITGFTLDNDGNMFFTISVQFQAYRLSPDGSISHFGKSGGGPGTFGVVAGIAVDEEGYIYVSDRLRCVVLVFDKNFEFVTEFGYRGYRPGNLVVPNDLDVDAQGRLYVAQAGQRGVSVFSISNK